MNQTASVQGFGTKKEARELLKQQLAQYVGQQPESMQAFHKWMKCLELASMTLIAVAFIAAMVVFINWTAVSPTTIPIAWFCFAASVSPTMVLIGIHSIILLTFPPIVLPGKLQKFVTGRDVMWSGWGFILGGLALAAFWGLFAYSVWTLNRTILEPLIGILGVGMGVMIVIGMVLTTYQKIFKSR